MVKKLQKTTKKQKIFTFFQKIKQILQKNVIYFHPLYLALLLWFLLIGLVKTFLLYTLVVLLHEGAHFVVAKRLGYVCHKIKLMPYGAVLDAETDDFSLKHEIIIAAVGPLFNLVLCLILVCLWWVFPALYNYSGEFLVFNLAIGLFNLLPIFPLDGGRILLAIISNRHSRAQCARFVKTIAACFGVLLFLLFIFSLFFTINITLGTVGIMLVCSAFSNDKETSYKRILLLPQKAKKLKKGLVVKNVLVNQNLTLNCLFKMVEPKFFMCYLICDDGFKVKKVVYENELSSLIEKHGMAAIIGQVV